MNHNRIILFYESQSYNFIYNSYINNLISINLHNLCLAIITL